MTHSPPARLDVSDLTGPYCLLDEYGVDWFTATQRPGDGAKDLEEVAETIGYEAVAQGDDSRAWDWNGYHGIQAGGVRWGSREDGSIVDLRSSYARLHWRYCMPCVRTVTRLDVQATIRLTRRDLLLVKQAETDALNHVGRRGRPVIPDGCTTGGLLTTMYLGRPQSEIRHRMYDKGRESRRMSPGFLFRFESQYRRVPATQRAFRLFALESDGAGILPMIKGDFESHGVDCPLECEGAPPISGRRDMPDDARRLVYLQNVVAPMIRHLIDRGLHEQVYRSLGLYWRGGDGPRSDDPAPTEAET